MKTFIPAVLMLCAVKGKGAGKCSASPSRDSFKYLSYFISGLADWCSVSLMFLSANWRPGTIQVLTPNPGRITACS